MEELRYPLNRRLSGLQNLSGPFKNENFLVLAGKETFHLPTRKVGTVLTAIFESPDSVV